MKQGTKRRLDPKDKHEKKSWQKRNEARKPKQEAFEQQVQAELERKAELVDQVDGLLDRALDNALAVPPVKTSGYYRDFEAPVVNIRLLEVPPEGTVIAARTPNTETYAATALDAVLLAGVQANADHLDAFLEDRLFPDSGIDAGADQQGAEEAAAVRNFTDTPATDLPVRTSDYYRDANDPLRATATE